MYPTPPQPGYATSTYGYDPRQSMYSDRSSMYSSGSGSSQYHGQQGYGPMANAGAYPSRALGRREIIMVSDDRVMSIQVAQPMS